VRWTSALPVLVLATNCAATVTGSVFVDENADGVRQVGESGIPAIVAFERGPFAATAASGAFELVIPDAGGIIWVRVPDGFRPGPVWHDTRAPGPAGAIDLPLVPLTDDERAAPITFVVASDSHATDNPEDPWDGGDIIGAVEQAIDLPEPPRFFTIVGDITQGNRAREFARIDEALDRVTVPWVPVPGNHDWYDGGAEYRRTYGPDNYSFDIDTIHFVVWDTNLTEDDQIAFVAADLAFVDAQAMTIVALGHSSPTDRVAEQFAAAGVDYLFTGHWHANRRVERSGLVEWATQTFIMGGLDDTPSGYRVVTFTGGVPAIVHRERMLVPHLELTAPDPFACVPAAPFPLVAAASISAGAPAVTARIDCGTPQLLAPAGGWTFTGTAPALAPGRHTITLEAKSVGGVTVTRAISLDVCEARSTPTPRPPVIGAWPQLAGGPTHTGARDEVLAPPLVTLWTAALGGTPALGSPVVADEIVVVALADRGGGDAGGLVALDLRTGAERWRVTTPMPVVNAPAIADGLVVSGRSDGVVTAYALATGAEAWSYDLSIGVDSFQTSLWSSPTIADGVVYAGIQGRMAALDLATGAPLWTHDPSPMYPWLGSRAAPAVADGVVITPFNRSVGFFGYDATSGVPEWVNTGGAIAAMNASPVIVDGVAYVANASGDLSALSIANGLVMWTRNLTPGGFDWGYSLTAAPAYADGRLFVPTKWHDLVALDAASGAELWRATSPESPINFTHYRSNVAGFVASPIVTGDVVWVGRPDGTLLALAADDGRALWVTRFGAPIAASPAPAGELLVVATYDGTVRALGPGTPVTADAPLDCPGWVEPPPPFEVGGGGGCSSRTDPQPLPILLALALALLRVRRLTAAYAHVRRRPITRR
jgi:outer membrane protein assembly factor BamB